ncbi:MAG: gliding motility-associated C-terminal domain-containing protein, partial [Bacteroidales bacterium]|nr:gliding motility-associated C-terminal domain-containing protein [Bacteroidales bacterium]
GSWSSISGATSDSYTVSDVSNNDAGDYRVEVSNTCGTRTSDAATLSVNDTIDITDQPNDQTGCEGSDITFSSTVNGDVTGYQWETDAGGSWSDISGATNTDLTLTDIENADEGNYRLKIQGVCGDDTTNTVSLAVSDTVSITSHPSDETVCEGEDATFSVSADGESPLSYQWYTNASGSWSSISGATSDSYTVSDVSNSDAGDYRVEVSNTCGAKYSDSASLSVRDTVSIIEHPKDKQVCENETVRFGLNAEGYGALSYTWQYNDGNGWTDLASVGDITVAEDSLIIENADTTYNGDYRAIIDGYCGDDTTEIANLYVNWFEVSIGEPSPFLIDTTSTLVELHVAVRNHEYLYDLNYELVTPQGTAVSLADTGNKYDAQYETNANLTFRSDLSTVFDVNNDSPDGSYGIKDNITPLHGKDPSNGAWKLRLGDWDRWFNGDPKGYIDSVRIGFTDSDMDTGESITVSYSDSSDIPINENSGASGSVAYTEYEVKDELSVDCYGDSTATAVVSTFGGISPFNIEWSEDRDFSSTISQFADEDTVELWAGTFYLRATDALGCTAIDSVTVNEPPEIILDSLDILSVTEQGGCYGDSIAEVHDSAYGGTGTLRYRLIRDPLGDLDTIDTNQSGDFTNLLGGEYMLEVFDDNNCIVDTIFTINRPDPIEITYEFFTSLSAPGASDGTVDVFAEGGTPPLIYTLYDTSGTFVADTSVSDTAHFDNLSEGYYYAVATDSNSCGPDTSSIFHIAPMQISFTTDSVNCAGGSTGQINAEVTGGEAPYTYEWVEVSSGSTLRTFDTTATSDTLKDLSAGRYALKVTDSTNISVQDTAVVYEPDPLEIVIEDTLSVPCNGTYDDFGVTVNGGTSPYDINWFNASMDTIATGDTANLNTGSYYIGVSDSNNCTAFDSVYVDEPEQISIDSVNLIPQGSEYTLEVWATGGNDSLFVTVETEDTLHNPDSGSHKNDTTVAVFESLSGGSYTITATDSLGCGPDQVNITFPITVSLSVVDPIDCYGDSNGAVAVQVQGGKPDYAYDWSDGTLHTHGEQQDTIYNLDADTYSITVTDYFGLEASASIDLDQPDPIVANPTIQQANCASDHEPLAGDDIGYIKLNPSGGTEYQSEEYNYRYHWSEETDTLAGKDSLMHLSGGSYQVTILDQNGCEASTSIDVPQSDENIIDMQFGGVVDSICHGDEVNLFVEEAQNADSLNWRNTSVGYETPEELDTLSENPTSPQTYVLEAKNAKCRYVDSVNVDLYPHLGVRINEQDDADDGTIRVKENVTAKSLNATVQNSDIQATYSWEPNEYFDPVDQLATELQVQRLRENDVAEQQIWIVGNTRNCTETDSATIEMVPNVEPHDAFSPNDDGTNDEWVIQYAEQYENIEVVVFNRWGTKVYRQKPYRNETGWKGKTSNGKRLPSGTYYYMIDTHENGIKPLSGTVTIIR